MYSQPEEDGNEFDSPFHQHCDNKTGKKGSYQQPTNIDDEETEAEDEETEEETDDDSHHRQPNNQFAQYINNNNVQFNGGQVDNDDTETEADDDEGVMHDDGDYEDDDEVMGEHRQLHIDFKPVQFKNGQQMRVNGDHSQDESDEDGLNEDGYSTMATGSTMPDDGEYQMSTETASKSAPNSSADVYDFTSDDEDGKSWSNINEMTNRLTNNILPTLVGTIPSTQQSHPFITQTQPDLQQLQAAATTGPRIAPMPAGGVPANQSLPSFVTATPSLFIQNQGGQAFFTAQNGSIRLVQFPPEMHASNGTCPQQMFNQLPAQPQQQFITTDQFTQPPSLAFAPVPGTDQLILPTAKKSRNRKKKQQDLPINQLNNNGLPSGLPESTSGSTTVQLIQQTYVPMKGRGKGNRKPRINFISVVDGFTVGADGVRRKFQCSHCGNGKSSFLSLSTFESKLFIN